MSVLATSIIGLGNGSVHVMDFAILQPDERSSQHSSQRALFDGTRLLASQHDDLVGLAERRVRRNPEAVSLTWIIGSRTHADTSAD